MKKILLLKGWITNIGNGFINMGAMSCLKKAFPNAEVIEVSCYNNLVIDKKLTSSIIRELYSKLFRKPLGCDFSSVSLLKNSILNVGELIDADLAVMPGCILLENELRKFVNTLRLLKDKGIPLILLGVAGEYHTKEQRYVIDFINKVKPHALLTRDSTAYDIYSSKFSYAYNGIDMAFFINDWYKPPKANESFIIATFDKISKPYIKKKDKNIYHLTHAPFDSPFSPLTLKIGKQILTLGKPKSQRIKVFLSDDIKDYLFFYANADEVHSDRVHACVASLAYGNKARLYYQTPRARLFDKILDDNIYKKLVQVNMKRLEEQKKSQILALKEAIDFI